MEPATISAGAAVVGTVIGGTSALATPSEGFVVDDGGGVQYPSEFEEEQFFGSKQSIHTPYVISFQSDLWWGDNLSCQVSMAGYGSGVNDELMCYPDSDDPNVPVNRFIKVSFAEGGDALDHSLLTCGIETMGVEGDPDNPYLSLKCHGRFDPYGSGDTFYEFQMFVDVYGQVSLGWSNPGETKISDESGYILVYYK